MFVRVYVKMGNKRYKLDKILKCHNAMVKNSYRGKFHLCKSLWAE